MVVEYAWTTDRSSIFQREYITKLKGIDVTTKAKEKKTTKKQQLGEGGSV